MRRIVVGAGDDADLVPLLPGVPDHSRLLKSSDRFLLLAVLDSTRRILVLVVLARALINLDHSIHFWIVVAPVGPHAVGPGGVWNRQALALAQLFVKQLRIVADRSAERHAVEG